jgi:capsular polysaccharide biosynthesis protein
MVFYNGNLQSYYHWMAEGIISLFLLQKLMHGRASVVLPAGLDGIAKVPYRDSLKLFSFGDFDLSFSDAPVVRLERATWVDPGYLAEDFPEHILREFQAAAAAAIGPQREPLRLYVERTHNRGVANAQEVRESLERLGFMTVRLEDLPLLEQARLFANAEFIVATHGAGLSNLIFTPPSARVIELTPDSEMRPFFWFLSQKLCQEYGMLPCPTEGGQFNGNLQVDVTKMMRLFNLLEGA